jgi:phage-related minor tail protein
MANQILARLGVVMTLNVAEWEDEVNKAIAAEKKLKREITRQNNDIEKEILKLTYAVKDYGREVSLVEKIQREFASGGKFEQATQSRKDALLSQAAAMDKLAASSKNFQQQTIKAAGLNTYQLQALSYQTTDIVTSLAGGQNPLLVLIQQGGQLRDQFGSVAGVFRAFASVLTVTKVVVGGLTVAFGGLAYAAFKGDEEFKAFNNSLILAGNTAGLTYDKFKGLSQTLAGGGMVGLKDAKDIFASLAASGQFTSKSIESVAQSIALVSRLSGQSVDVVGKELVSAFNGTASSAKNLNEKYNFLTLAQYRQIEALERVGDRQGAINTLSQALNEKLEKQAPQLGIIAKLWNSIADTFERIKSIGAPNTDLEILNALAKQIDYFAGRVTLFPDSEVWAGKLKKEIEKFEALSGKMREADKKRKDDEQKAEEERKKIDIATPLGALIEKDFQLRKTLDDNLYQHRLANAEGLARISVEANKKVADANREYDQKNEKEKSQNILINKKQLNAELAGIEAERIQKLNAMESAAKKAIDEKISSVLIEVSAQKELLNLFDKQKVVTQDDIEQIKVRAKLADEIYKIMASKEISERQKLISTALLTQAYAQKEILDGRVKLAQKAIETEKTLRDEQKTQSDSIELEKTKLELFSKSILISAADRDIALSRLETEQKIATIRQKIIDNPEFARRGEELIVNQNVIQQRKEEVIGLAERLKLLGDVNQSVFNNMESAIVNFVKTGKLSFKDLARSIIQDILAIYLKAQLLQMFKGLGGLFTGGGNSSLAADIGSAGGGANFAKVIAGGYMADGGPVAANIPYIVGERGPELIIPKGAGTVIPNNQLAGAMGGPQITYNGPYIANMQAIDTQSATQFLARNKLSVYAANQSAARSLPTSR